MDPSVKRNRNSDGYKPQAIPRALKVISSYKEDNSMENVKVSSDSIQIVSFEEKKFVGIAVTSSFQKVTGIGEASQVFMKRKNGIQCIVNVDEYVCLHFSNEVVFTYIYCMEVSKLETIPEGMIGITVPGSRYAITRSKNEDPYGLINTFLRDNGLESNPQLFAFEVFRFGKEENKYNADILVPIIEKQT
jgi:predicted transcriptional regulator YdeE